MPSATGEAVSMVLLVASETQSNVQSFKFPQYQRNVAHTLAAIVKRVDESLSISDMRVSQFTEMLPGENELFQSHFHFTHFLFAPT